MEGCPTCGNTEMLNKQIADSGLMYVTMMVDCGNGHEYYRSYDFAETEAM